MNKNDGLGKVTQKSKEVITDEILGTTTAVRHANGRDWWIFISRQGANRFFRILFSNNQIVELEEIDTGANFGSNLATVATLFSPDGSKYIRYEIEHGVYIYDFNRCLGELSNPIFIRLYLQ